jgi:hypothetical protein
VNTPSVFIAQQGEGIPPLKGELKQAILKRIERLGKMNDRRMKYIVAGDRMGLIDLAEEYEARMPRMAVEIRKEAQEL